MRPVPWLEAEKYRFQVPGMESEYGEGYGVFLIPYKGVKLRAIACDGNVSRQESGHLYAWDHVSVSLANRCPNWPEMSYIKGLFWTDDETVLQFHPMRQKYVNIHPNVLHLWKPLNEFIRLPPGDMV